MQTERNLQFVYIEQTVSDANIKNGFMEGQIPWPQTWQNLPNQPKGGYYATGSFSHLSQNTDAKDCCIDKGLRDKQPDKILYVVGFVPGAVQSGDTISFTVRGWQN